jgi:signal transduction histidine kinase
MATDTAVRHDLVRRTAVSLVVFAVVALAVLGLVLSALDGRAGGAVVGVVGPLAFTAVGGLVAVQRPDNRLGWLFLVGAVLMTVLGVGGEYAKRALVDAPGSLPAGTFVAWLADSMATPMAGVLAGLLPQLFPTGRPLSRRWRFLVWAACGYILLAFAGNAVAAQKLESVPQIDNPYAVAALQGAVGPVVGISGLCGVVALVGGVVTLALRWRRAAGDERQQLKWFLAGVVWLPIPLVLHGVVSSTIDDALFSFVFVLIPVVRGVAILRYRLYDLDLAVRRTVAYATVTALVVGLYLAVVATAALAVSGAVPLGAHVAAAVAAAAVFQPLRSRVHRAVDRVYYGDRARPYEAVGRLARRLEAAAAPETVLPTVVETVADALRVPYVGIELDDGGLRVLAAEHGTRSLEPVSFPMTYQNDVVGRMLVSPRDARDPLGPADLRLLADLARQAGVAAAAVRTTTALLRSRSELVAAREEERRRLRRDLHDGLGPTLAGVTLGLHAARAKLAADPEESERLLAAIETEVEEAVADVRRLVYGLRPPALDEFGLVRAVQLHAARFDGTQGGLRVVVDSPPEGLGVLPAAVEVAAYRIATEALTNVARHAQAQTCTVRLSLNGALEVEVTDDGRGFAAEPDVGVGLAAMRERAAELGGTLSLERPETGARVRARLPIPEPR